MAKATVTSVQLELTPSEATALKVLLNATCNKGLFVAEYQAMFKALSVVSAPNCDAHFYAGMGTIHFTESE